MIIKTYYPGEPVNIHMQSLINIIQDNNWGITTKKGKGKFPLFCGNIEWVIPLYYIRCYSLPKYLPYLLSYTLHALYICLSFHGYPCMHHSLLDIQCSILIKLSRALASNVYLPFIYFDLFLENQFIGDIALHSSLSCSSMSAFLHGLIPSTSPLNFISTSRDW